MYLFLITMVILAFFMFRHKLRISNGGCGVYRHVQQYLSYVVAVSFIGGGNRKKAPTCVKSLTSFIT